MSREFGDFVVTVERQGRQWRIEAFNGEQTWSKLVANPLGRAALSFLKEVGLSRSDITRYRRWVERLTESSEKEEQGDKRRGSRPPRRKAPAEGAVQQQTAEEAPAEQDGKASAAEPPRAEDTEGKTASGDVKVPSAAEAPRESTAGEAAPEPSAPQQVEPPPQMPEGAEGAAQGEVNSSPVKAQRGQSAEAAGSLSEDEGTAEAEEPPFPAAKGQSICGEKDAQAFTVRDLAILVKLFKGSPGKARYEIKVVRVSNCSLVDLIPEIGSPTSRSVDKMLRKAGLTPDEIAKFVEWVRGLGSKRRPDKAEIAMTFRRVVESARSALSGRLDSPYLDLLIPKRDKETLVNCRPAECWKSANAAAVVPSKISKHLGILDIDSERALMEVKNLGFDPMRNMHILAGPTVDAVLTPEGKWRTPDGRVLDNVQRKLHIPVYIPDECQEDLIAPGLEVRCGIASVAINIAGRHPSGAQYEFIDGELLEASWDQIEELVADLGGRVPDFLTPPKCEAANQVDVDMLTSLFQRIYTAAQAAGYARHDAIYDLAILGRFACVDKESIKEVVKRVYGITGDESQTLSQRLTHVERAFRASEDGGPKLRSPKTIRYRWLMIDKEAAEGIFKLLNIDTAILGDFLATECLSVVGNDPQTAVCDEMVVAELVNKELWISFLRQQCHSHKDKETGEELEVCISSRQFIYRGPRPRLVKDIARRTWFYEVGGFYGSSLEQVIQKLRQPSADVDVFVNTKQLDVLVSILKKAAERKEVALTIGLLPAESGAVLVDDHGILDLGPSPEEAVADFDRALRSVLAVYPEANHDPALAAVGYILGLNAAPIWWFHRPNSEVPLPIVHGASGLGKSELMRRVVEPAVVGLEAKKRVGLIREKITDEMLYDYLAPDVYKVAEYSTPEQLRNDLDTNTLVLILDEQKPGDPRNQKAPAKIFGRFWLQVATAEWGRRLSQHAARYGGGFGYKFFRQRAFAIVTNYSPDEWKRAGLAEAVSAEGAIDRRIFEIPWEDQKLDGSKLDLIYMPKYSVLKALEVTINKHFAELKSQGRFADFVVALWRKVVEDFEPKLGRLDGIRRMIEALERLAQYNLEKNRLRDPVIAAREELKRNALAYLREEAKISDLSPAKFVGKIVEYAAELGLVFRKPRWADEVNAARIGFCKALANAVDIPDYACEDFATLEIEGHDNPAGAPLFNQVMNREMREALWSVFTNYAAKGYTPSVLAGSVLWPKNTRNLGKIPRTCGKHLSGEVDCYYKMTWGDFFEVFVGKLIESEAAEEGQVLIGAEVLNAPMHLTNSEEQKTNIETTTPTNIDTNQAQSGLSTLSTLSTELPKGINEKPEILHVSEAVEKREESAEQVPVKSAEAPPAPPAASEAKAATPEASQGQINLAPADPAAACMSNPICGNRLKLCIWKNLKVPREEKKKALYAEIERRGELFAHCIKDAVEYAERESKR